MANVNETKALELNVEQMTKFIIDGVMRSGAIKVNGGNGKVNLNIKVSYKAKGNEDGSFALGGCLLEITPEVKPEIIDASDILN